MTLINCPDCKTEVSDKAEKCLKCGRPIYKPEIEISETAANNRVNINHFRFFYYVVYI